MKNLRGRPFRVVLPVSLLLPALLGYPAGEAGRAVASVSSLHLLLLSEADGACCRHGCQMSTRVECEAVEGLHQGDGVPCEPDPCPHGCTGFCGQYQPVDKCWCDAKCHTAGDCCPDVCAVCGYCGP